MKRTSKTNSTNTTLTSTPSHPHHLTTTSEETQSTTDDELVRVTQRLRVKEEDEEGVGPATPPEAPPNTSASEFISSLKVSVCVCIRY